MQNAVNSEYETLKRRTQKVIRIANSGNIHGLCIHDKYAFRGENRSTNIINVGAKFFQEISHRLYRFIGRPAISTD